MQLESFAGKTLWIWRGYSGADPSFPACGFREAASKDGTSQHILRNLHQSSDSISQLLSGGWLSLGFLLTIKQWVKGSD